ncbi:putative ATP-dependent protease [Acidovorax sp. CF316]|uniref:AAA family ATPase n=1 Tax=Acidovorax sp. CF316 TaxID=1144317 RepID=UPI00026BD04F|nr:ATP-binding protein [Acidovorax sp. CF316]EJE49542.1 putative ATP-dependent protease [Acidovorax sp. CF316]
MPASARALSAHQLRLIIDPATLGFASTAELTGLPLPWIGQERAEAAARFGLAMQQPDYHLFVLGDVGSGRASLLHQAMLAEAARRPVPPDLCYLHDFDAPDRPRALRLPAGQGRLLRQALADMGTRLETEVPQHLANPTFLADAARVEQRWQAQENDALVVLDAFALARQLRLVRNNGQMAITPLGPRGQPLSEAEARVLPPERRAAIARDEDALRAEIDRFAQAMHPLERERDAALAALRRAVVQPLVQQALHGARQIAPEATRLTQWLDQVERALLDSIDLLEPYYGDNEADAEADRKDDLDALLARCRVNLAVDNGGRSGAPVIVEDNPQQRSLMGSIDHGANADDADPGQADVSAIHAGSLLRAHGGFILLHLQDLTAEEGLWPRVRRFLRSRRLQISDDAGGSGAGGGAPAGLQPEPVEVDVKIVLVGSVDEYYALQDNDPEAARRFRVKVDFADRFIATPATHRATATFVAQCCAQRGLPHFGPEAVALLIEQSHREADDQGRQSARFAQAEALVIESAALCRMRNPADATALVQAADVQAALAAQRLRHNQTEEELHQTLVEGECLITLHGQAVGQVNALSQIDLTDYRFGFPVRITARSFAGQEGLLNIDREVHMSGPIHDKGVLILHGYLTALFSHVAPLALNASIVFEQEYSGVEGDSASCAELYALLSSLSGLPLRQGIAVTGALNQHGEVLPVGGINEKIEGWFQACAAAGLDGTQGALIPARNQRHLMLSRPILEAVERGLFHVYTVQHVSEGIALLTGEASGMGPGAVLAADAADEVTHTVLSRAEQTLRAYRRACQSAGHTRAGRTGRGRRRD